MMKQEVLDDVFEASCNAVIDGLGGVGEEAEKQKTKYINCALALLEYTKHEVAFEHNEQIRQVANKLKLVNTDGNGPPTFDDDDEEEGVG